MTAQNPLAQLIADLHPQPGISATRIPGVHLMQAERDYPRGPIFYEPRICIIAQGQKIGHLGGETYRYDAHHYLVMSVPLPFECETHASPGEPLLGFKVDVEIGVLKELLLQMEDVPGDPEDSEVAPSAPMASMPLDAGMQDAALRLVRCLHSPMDSHILGPQLVREIIFRALRSEQGSALRAVAGRHNGYGRMARALRRIHTDYASALDIDTLAREANMSVSTFHHNFKAMTFTSPLQYLKSVRLYKAWSLMVQDGLNASTAASQVGYESPSQFSREFKRYFGRTPSEEVQAARG
ncbi:AraC family transcriptional regulator [Pseudomonas paraeruginosa]|uniref:AraC family transcriptional regulator n=1 Tax=Pseudomonas paraeruginosa TaxID=2994495 RepID=UPI0039FC8753